MQSSSTGETAKEQARYVARTGQEQAREAARHVSGQVRDEADSQTKRLAQGLRGLSDDLAEMSSSGSSDSPAHGLVKQAAEGGRQAADWLDRRGLDGLLSEARSFARRRPGAFLLGAAVAGFAVGRLAKATTSGASSDGDDATQGSRRDAFPPQGPDVPVTDPGYPEPGMTTQPYGTGDRPPGMDQPYGTGGQAPGTAQPYGAGGQAPGTGYPPEPRPGYPDADYQETEPGTRPYGTGDRPPGTETRSADDR